MNAVVIVSSASRHRPGAGRPENNALGGVMFVAYYYRFPANFTVRPMPLQHASRLLETASRIILGKERELRLALACLVARGHLLLEDVPGVGKTTLAHVIATLVGLQFQRIQFTSDLLPADILGVSVFDRASSAFRFQPGPVFAQLILADEINRATPKTQSALLEAMQEKTVTSGSSTHQLESPFLVMATQNPIEMEGTYPLPEAQLDRFLMKILVDYPNREELNRIVERTIQRDEPDLDQIMDRQEILAIRRACREVLIAPHVQDFAVSLVMATQPGTSSAHALSNRYIRYGSSPRGAQALVECGRVYAFMRGRAHLAVDDVAAIAPSVLRHRIILNFDAHADNQTSETLLKEIIASTSSLVRA
jgi:MoxR-like ATPase